MNENDRRKYIDSIKDDFTKYPDHREIFIKMYEDLYYGKSHEIDLYMKKIYKVYNLRYIDNNTIYTDIIYYVYKWAKSFDNTSETEEQNAMKDEVMKYEVVTKLVIDDKDTAKMEPGQLLSYISDAKEEIDKLTSYGIKSKYIEREISRLEYFIKQVLKILDDREV